MAYKKADARNPYMGLDNKICENPVYWCRLHEVWLSEKDAERKKCKAKLSYDMLDRRKCNCLVKKQPQAAAKFGQNTKQ